ncbi:hypothetical protein B9Z55_015541 [Caenorhabditis nigoni]|uniref:Uncharacterized protein n=1 Tax=Caenorhabditis nigoni TaxID=1611254 RepID=A0A2G5UAN9_9PELO|nr:hypothetical protein B9Z55_015541 [Caenorhabditis nigoni]
MKFFGKRNGSITIKHGDGRGGPPNARIRQYRGSRFEHTFEIDFPKVSRIHTNQKTIEEMEYEEAASENIRRNETVTMENSFTIG